MSDDYTLHVLTGCILAAGLLTACAAAICERVAEARHMRRIERRCRNLPAQEFNVPTAAPDATTPAGRAPTRPRGWGRVAAVGFPSMLEG